MDGGGLGQSTSPLISFSFPLPQADRYQCPIGRPTQNHHSSPFPCRLHMCKGKRGRNQIPTNFQRHPSQSGFDRSPPHPTAGACVLTKMLYLPSSSSSKVVYAVVTSPPPSSSIHFLHLIHHPRRPRQLCSTYALAAREPGYFSSYISAWVFGGFFLRHIFRQAFSSMSPPIVPAALGRCGGFTNFQLILFCLSDHFLKDGDFFPLRNRREGGGITGANVTAATLSRRPIDRPSFFRGRGEETPLSTLDLPQICAPNRMGVERGRKTRLKREVERGFFLLFPIPPVLLPRS